MLAIRLGLASSWEFLRAAMAGRQSMQLVELTSWFYSTEQNFDFSSSLSDDVSSLSSICLLVSKYMFIWSLYTVREGNIGQ